MNTIVTNKFINSSQTLTHIAVVMDGNGRWAERRGYVRNQGHKIGVSSLKQLVKNCINESIQYLTVFAFSSENWTRTDSEIVFLMTLFERTIRAELQELSKKGVRLKFVGNNDSLPDSLVRAMREAEQTTKSNNLLGLNICFNYGGKWDIVQGIKKLLENNPDVIKDYTKLTEQSFSQYLALADIPEPDLFIRTGGEQRLSNFLLWNLAYTELYFTDILWPDFDKGDLKEAIDFYVGRKRKFGGTVDFRVGASEDENNDQLSNIL